MYELLNKNTVYDTDSNEISSLGSVPKGASIIVPEWLKGCLLSKEDYNFSFIKTIYLNKFSYRVRGAYHRVYFSVIDCIRFSVLPTLCDGEIDLRLDGEDFERKSFLSVYKNVFPKGVIKYTGGDYLIGRGITSNKITVSLGDYNLDGSCYVYIHDYVALLLRDDFTLDAIGIICETFMFSINLHCIIWTRNPYIAKMQFLCSHHKK